MSRKKRSKSSAQMAPTISQSGTSGLPSQTLEASADLVKKVSSKSCSTLQVAESHTQEAVRAKKYLQACLLERYFWELNEDKKDIINKTLKTAEKRFSHQGINKLHDAYGNMEATLSTELDKIELRRQKAQGVFRSNIKKIDEGRPLTELELFAPHLSLNDVDSFIAKYTGESDLEVHLESSFNSHDSDSTDSAICMSPQNNHADQWWTLEEHSASPIHTSSVTVIPSDTVIAAASAASPPVRDIFLDDEAIQKVVHQKPEASQKGLRKLCDLVPFDIDGFQGSFSRSTPTEHDFEKISNDIYISTDDDDDNDLVKISQDIPIPGTFSSFPVVDTWTSTCLATSPRLAEISKIWSDYSTPVVSVSIGSGVPNSTSIFDKLLPNAPQKAIHSQDQTANKQPKKKRKKGKKKKTAINSDDDITNILGTENLGLNFFWIQPEDLAAENKIGSETVITPASQPQTSATKSWAAVMKEPPAPVQVVRPKQPQKVPEQQDDEYLVYNSKSSRRKFPASSSLNKTSICYTFEKMGLCPWGDECIFAHGKSELREVPLWFKREEEKRLKAGKNSKKPDHPEPCNQQLCIGRLNYLLHKTSICKLWQSKKCHKDKATCDYAHGKDDLLPLPKYEMCERFKHKKCPNKADECVYAHSKAELRKPDAKNLKTSIAKSRTRSAELMEHVTFASALIDGHRLRTISEGSRFSQLTIDDEELDNECLFCANPLMEDDKYALMECGHDQFHMACIAVWINDKSPTCPLCRTASERIDME